MAKGLARDIGDAAQASAQERRTKTKARVVDAASGDDERGTHPPRMKGGRSHERTKLHVPVRSPIAQSSDWSEKCFQDASATTSYRVHLPDVTGLTSAVATPAKPDLAYKPYPKKGNNAEQGECPIDDMRLPV